ADKDKEEKKDSKVAEKPSTDLPSPSATAADPEADLMSCRRLESNAFNACMASGASSADMNELRRLSSTSPDQNGMGLNEYCRRMDQLTDLASRTNMAYAASCAVAQSTCRATCEALAENYYEGDETAIKLYVLADACADYGSRANYAAMSGVSTGYNAAYATYCTQ